jgi:hypothetical protein
VPIPYPNTAAASDTTNGTTTVMISGQEVMMKDQSTFKKSTGDEAATKSLGMGIVTHTIQGEASFVAWSMDVKFEGANVDRHLDMTVNNEQSLAADTPPWVYLDASAFGNDSACAGDKDKMETACGTDKKGKTKRHCPGALSVGKKKQVKTHGGDVNKAGAAAEKDANACVKAQRCYLRPYKPTQDKDGCCPGQTGHHIPPKACFKKSKRKYLGKYSPSSALCVCMEGQNQHCGSHGKNHAAIESLADHIGLSEGDPCSVSDYNKLCAETLKAQCGCDPKCIEKQLNDQAKDHGVTEIKHVDTNSSADISKFENRMLKNTELDATMGD